MPANAPAIFFRPGLATKPVPDANYAFELRGPDTIVVPITVESDGRDGFLIRPKQALQPDKHVLSYRDDCGIVGSTGGRAETTINVVAAAPLPTPVGSVTVAPVNQAGGCGYRADHVVKLTANPDLAAYDGLVTELKVVAGGKSMSVDGGTLGANGGSAQLPLDFACGPGLPTSVKSRVEVSVVIAGAVPQPLMIEEVAFNCLAEPACPLPPNPDLGDGGLYDDGGVPSTTTTSPSTSVDGGSPPSDASSGGACSVGFGKPSGGTVTFSLAVVLAWATARLRRGRRTRRDR